LLLHAKATGNTRFLAEHEQLEKRLSTKTMGALLKWVSTRVKFNEKGRRLLQLALGRRNRLVHGYFWDRAEDLCTGQGQRSIMSELLDMIRIFTFADNFCGAISKALYATAGVSEESIEHELSKMKERLQITDI